MESSQCCRTCLSEQNLNVIFALPEYIEKYTEIIFTTTGIKVEITDSLPKYMCTACINFINECYKFRKKCQETDKTLLELFANKPFIKIKTENITNETTIFIDTSDCKDFADNDFHDYDDNITLSEYNNTIKSETCKELESNNISKELVSNVKNKNHSKTKTNQIKLVKTEHLLVEQKKVRRKYTKRKICENKLITSDKDEIVQKEVKVEPESYKCEFCPKVFKSKWSILSHKKIHTGLRVICEHCGKKFITPRRLLIHCKAKHGYEKTDKCSFCEYRGIDPSQVKIHERLHTGEKPYVCTTCGASFHRSSSYHQHVASHLPDKTVQCDQCPARFKSATLMRIHRQRHAARYTYSCRVCDNTFARRTNVVRHLLRIHSIKAQPEHIARNKRE